MEIVDSFLILLFLENKLKTFINGYDGVCELVIYKFYYIAVLSIHIYIYQFCFYHKVILTVASTSKSIRIIICTVCIGLFHQCSVCVPLLTMLVFSSWVNDTMILMPKSTERNKHDFNCSSVHDISK